MDREVFIKRLEIFQTSSASMDVKTKAIDRLKNEFFNQDRGNKVKQLLCDISLSSSELKSSELH